MANIFEFPLLNPLRQLWQSDNQAISGTTYLNVFNPQFNFKGFDDDFFKRMYKPYEQKVNYIQPFQQSDTIRLQWLGSDSTLGHYQHARLLDVNGIEYTSKTVTVVQESGTWDSMKLYTITIQLYDVPEGVYFLQLSYNPGSSNQYIIFEPFDLKQSHPKTVRIDYYSTFNDQSVVYPSSSFIFQKRIDGLMAEMDTGSKFNVYEDQPLNSEMVSGIAFRTYLLNLGNFTQGLPEWEADKLERILLCDSVWVDGVKVTREQGSKLEVKRNAAFPLSQYSIKLRERINTTTFDIFSNTLIIGTMPQTSYFWIESMDIGTTRTIQKKFNGKRNFLDFLNSTYLLNSGYWGEDAKGQLVYVITNGTALAGTYQLTSANTLQYGFKAVLVGSGDFGIDISAPSAGNFYAVYYSDGSTGVNKTAMATTPSLTNISHTFATLTTKEVYVFFSNCKSIADNVMSINCKSIGGDLAPGMTSFYPFQNSPSINYMENNMFLYVTALSTLNLGGYAMNSYMINQILIWIYDNLTHFSSCTITLSGQNPSAPPTKSDSGIARVVQGIKAANTLNTD